MGQPFRIEYLDKKQHDRQSFDCGVDVLNHYLQRQATQDMRRQVAICYVAVDTATDHLAGYYTVAAANMALNDLPEATAKKLPRYPVIPAVRIGRLAVARSFQGRKLGGLLLADAIKRSLHTGVGVYAVLVDAKDQQAADFYGKFGFMPLLDQPLTLFLPVSAQLLQAIQ